MSNVADVKISMKYSVICCSIISLIHFHLFGYSIAQSNIPLFGSIMMIHFVILTNVQFVIKMGRSFELAKSIKLLRSMTKIGAFLFFGSVFHAISISSSSFIEEEHQTWYYLNNTVWLILYIIETRRSFNKKPVGKLATVTSNDSREIFIQNQVEWILLFCGHLIARRLNQTGDKWLNIPDIGDWLQMEENRIWNSLFMCASLLLVYLCCMDFGSILTNVLTLTACMLIYYYRTINGSVYLAGIKASG